ncbi:MAG: NAD(P)H-hydrate dehydratase [Anaerolineae bacterium]|nr:NAD(P)H-hydrate dehydratase [Anaerolineae bacterium]
MLKVVSVEHMRRIEAAADASGLSYDTMMQNAGTAAAQRIADYLADSTSEQHIVFLIGPGNNGGDGLVAGHVLAQMDQRFKIAFYLLTRRTEDDSNFKAVTDSGLSVVYAQDDAGFAALRRLTTEADVLVDALFGIGVRLPLRENAAAALREVRQVMDKRQSEAEHLWTMPAWPQQRVPDRRPYVVAIDCPSGLDCDTGAMDANTIHAQETITFIAAKPGLFVFPGATAVGTVLVATIGIPSDLPELEEASTVLVDDFLVRDLLPERRLDANKGTFGKTLIVAGSSRYVGAAGLSALAAYRTGTGLVTVGTPEPVVNKLAGHILEPTWLPLPHEAGMVSEKAVQIIRDELPKYDALLAGSGWGQSDGTREFLDHLLNQPIPSPMVMDADGLNLLAGMPGWWSQIPDYTVITPHPGEMARLAGISTAEVQANRRAIALAKAAEWRVVLVLKGAHTLIATPDGQLFILPFKTDALATAGTGDILAGTIAGFLSQGLNPLHAAVCGGYLHGLAGMWAARRTGNTRSVTAGDVLQALSPALTHIERGG